MDIGKERPAITIEPIQTPVPERVPERATPPTPAPEKTPVKPQREKVPA